MATQESKHVDRRILRTKRNIRSAFLELIEEKPMTQITIMELAEKADINRKTFYVYYNGPEDILREVEDELLEKVMYIFEKHMLESNFTDGYHFFEELSTTISEDAEWYHALNHSDLLSHMVERAKQQIVTLVSEHYRLSSLENQEVYMLSVDFLASGILSMFTTWLKGGTSISIQELTKTAGDLVMHGITPIVQQILANAKPADGIKS